MYEKLCPYCDKSVKIGELEVWDATGRKWHWLCTQKVLVKIDKLRDVTDSLAELLVHSDNVEEMMSRISSYDAFFCENLADKLDKIEVRLQEILQELAMTRKKKKELEAQVVMLREEVEWLKSIPLKIADKALHVALSSLHVPNIDLWAVHEMGMRIAKTELEIRYDIRRE